MQERQGSQGFTLIELLIVVAIIGVIAAIAVPALMRARMSGNETSAIGSLRAISTAQASYAAGCGNGSFAVLFATLGTPPPGGDTAFLQPELTGAVSPQKSGFTFTLAAGSGSIAGPNDCNGTATRSTYYSTAVPLAPTTTGNRAFASNHTNTIWQNVAAGGASAPTEPFTVSASVMPIQ